MANERYQQLQRIGKKGREIGNGSRGDLYPRFAYVMLKMVTGIFHAVILNAFNSVPALSERTSQLHRWGKEKLKDLH